MSMAESTSKLNKKMQQESTTVEDVSHTVASSDARKSKICKLKVRYNSEVISTSTDNLEESSIKETTQAGSAVHSWITNTASREESTSFDL
jgi:hypothetical protein